MPMIALMDAPLPPVMFDPPQVVRRAVAVAVHRQCCWLEGSDRRSFVQCEAVADPGVSYCRGHAMRAFTNYRPRMAEVAA